MFARIADASAEGVMVMLNGTPFEGRQGDSVASLMLLAGKVACRKTLLSGEPRGPYCLMGVCFECLVKIDGVEGQQACMIQIRPGMRIETASDES